MTGRAPIAVTGLGVVSPLGHSVEELTRRVAAGERAVAEADGGVYVGDLPLDVVPADKRARIGRLDRFCRLFLAAAYLAMDDARLPGKKPAGERVGLSFGTGLGCLLSNAEFYEKVVEQGVAAASPRVFAYTVSNAAAGEVSIALGIHGPNVTLHAGLAAGLTALGYGVDLLRLGKADVVLAGGADANGAAIVRALADMRLLKSAEAARPFVDTVAGVCPSEGAVVAVLERAEHARGRGARCRAWIDGRAAGFEPTLTRRDPAVDGVRATLCRALADGRRAADTVDLVVASAHGTPRDAVEGRALRDVLGENVALLAPKRALGEGFAASGGLGVALAAGWFGGAAAADGVVIGLDGEARSLPRPPRTVMVDAWCYSGAVAALLVSAP